MQEYQQDTDWTDKPDGKEEYTEKGRSHRAPVGEFITRNLFRNKPSDKDTGKKRTQRKKDVAREVIAAVEETLLTDEMV